MSSLERAIIKNGSMTHYLSSKFFPKNVRKDVFKLYSFLRVADDYVDSIPQNKKEFKVLKTLWDDAIEDSSFDVTHTKNESLNERVVKNMVELVRTYHFDPSWVDAFLASMQADIDKKTYASLDGALWYVYGSAEVIGYMMAKIMDLPDESLRYAALQGRALQWINCIRDIKEDTGLGRCYFPKEDLEKFDLEDLKQTTASANPKAFKDFIHFELNRYRQWQREAEKGYKYIPKRLRIPLEIVVDNSNWIARTIANNPGMIYEYKITSKKLHILSVGIKKALA